MVSPIFYIEKEQTFRSSRQAIVLRPFDNVNRPRRYNHILPHSQMKTQPTLTRFHSTNQIANSTQNFFSLLSVEYMLSRGFLSENRIFKAKIHSRESTVDL